VASMAARVTFVVEVPVIEGETLAQRRERCHRAAISAAEDMTFEPGLLSLSKADWWPEMPEEVSLTLEDPDSSTVEVEDVRAAQVQR
jgi:hypothetical protein